MKFAVSKSFPAFFLTSFLLIGCGRDESASSNTAPATINQIINTETNKPIVPKDDPEEFAKIVKMPFEPEEVVYKPNLKAIADGNTANAANEKKLIAVLKFSAENADKIVAQAAKYKSPVALDIDAESWFPAELIAQSQLSGDDVLKGKSYPANDFIQPPYTAGKITRIDDTDYFVLELASS